MKAPPPPPDAGGGGIAPLEEDDELLLELDEELELLEEDDEPEDELEELELLDEVRVAIHDDTSAMSVVSSSVLASGGICPGPRVLILVSSMECAVSAGVITWLALLPPLFTSAPLISPALAVGVSIRASQLPRAAPPGWWH